MKDFDLDEELGEELGEELAEDANRLIFIKKSIAELQEEEQSIKKKLEPRIGLAKPLLIPDGIIYFCSKKTAKSFNRTEVLEFIEELCGPEIGILHFTIYTLCNYKSDKAIKSNPFSCINESEKLSIHFTFTICIHVINQHSRFPIST
jgi:hypothetical protein